MGGAETPQKPWELQNNNKTKKSARDYRLLTKYNVPITTVGELTVTKLVNTGTFPFLHLHSAM